MEKDKAKAEKDKDKAEKSKAKTPVVEIAGDESDEADETDDAPVGKPTASGRKAKPKKNFTAATPSSTGRQPRQPSVEIGEELPELPGPRNRPSRTRLRDSTQPSISTAPTPAPDKIQTTPAPGKAQTPKPMKLSWKTQQAIKAGKPYCYRGDGAHDLDDGNAGVLERCASYKDTGCKMHTHRRELCSGFRKDMQETEEWLCSEHDGHDFDEGDFDPQVQLQRLQEAQARALAEKLPRPQADESTDTGATAPIEETDQPEKQPEPGEPEEEVVPVCHKGDGSGRSLREKLNRCVAEDRGQRCQVHTHLRQACSGKRGGLGPRADWLCPYHRTKLGRESEYIDEDEEAKDAEKKSARKRRRRSSKVDLDKSDEDDAPAPQPSNKKTRTGWSAVNNKEGLQHTTPEAMTTSLVGARTPEDIRDKKTALKTHIAKHERDLSKAIKTKNSGAHKTALTMLGVYREELQDLEFDEQKRKAQAFKVSCGHRLGSTVS